MASALTIREASESDAESIVALLNPIIVAGSYTILDAPISVAAEREFIRDFPARGVCHVAVDEAGALLGIQDVITLVPGVLALEHVGTISTFVALDSLRAGVGRQLCDVTFELARDRGYRKLSAMIRADNPVALGFYRSVGFEVIGIAKQHARVGERYLDEVLVERLLA